MMPLFEAGSKDALITLLTLQNAERVSAQAIPNFQIILNGAQNPQSLRSLKADHLNKLIKVLANHKKFMCLFNVEIISLLLVLIVAWHRHFMHENKVEGNYDLSKM